MITDHFLIFEETPIPMKHLLLFLFFCGSFLTYSQEPININGLLAPNSEKELWFYVQPGDKLNFSCSAEKKKRISKLTVTQYPNTVLFQERKFKKLANELSFIDAQFVKVTLENNNKEAITIAFKAEQISDKTVKQVRFEQATDTSYGYPTTRFRKVEGLETMTVQNDKFYLNSRSNALIKGGKRRVLLPIQLPENTTEWYYVLTASRNEEEVNSTRSTFNLASELSEYIKKEESLQNSVNTLAPPPGADICDVYLMDQTNAELFKGKKTFKYDLSSSRENYKSGVIKVKNSGGRDIYIGINNPNNLYGIHVGIEVVAITKAQNIIPETIRIPIITSYLKPVAQ